MAYDYPISKNLPPSTGESPNLGAQRIRHFKEAIIERLKNWVYGFASDSETDEGLKKAPFKTGSAPSQEADKVIVYAKDISNVAQLFVKDENGVEMQIGTPTGVIVMWSGLIANIPSGWHLCDGTNGTPNLFDKFILGVASAAENPGGAGGAHSVALSAANLPAHDHGSVGSHQHAAVGDHAHEIRRVGGISPGMRRMDAWHGEYTPLSTDPAGAHQHAAAGDHTHSSVGSGTAHENRPAYFKLAYIMKL